MVRKISGPNFADLTKHEGVTVGACRGGLAHLHSPIHSHVPCLGASHFGGCHTLAPPKQRRRTIHLRGTAIREGSYWKCATEPWCISIPPTPQNLYLELGRLIAGTPELVSGPITPDVRRWLASANALVRSSGSLTDGLQFAAACENLDGPLRGRHAETVTTILHRMLVKAELSSPPELRGSVLLIGEDRDAYTAMRHLLRTATSSSAGFGAGSRDLGKIEN